MWSFLISASTDKKTVVTEVQTKIPARGAGRSRVASLVIILDCAHGQVQRRRRTPAVAYQTDPSRSRSHLIGLNLPTLLIFLPTFPYWREQARCLIHQRRYMQVCACTQLFTIAGLIWIQRFLYCTVQVMYLFPFSSELKEGMKYAVGYDASVQCPFARFPAWLARAASHCSGHECRLRYRAIKSCSAKEVMGSYGMVDL
jgi:hypothetical protein